ncbi:hypothetical protein Baya_2497 [Bagarius yarrelli]|uniref:Uncharacterized protein n=1 Tax=Bagarius yarrelli TaxID=175774 RepID=A0A556TP43_BAGYA|nr:hypothetical protein Baya_2497 [Bagarius yarrelli]
MGIESQGAAQPAVSLTPRQVKTFQKVEPKALGSVQIIIAVLCLCLSISVLQIYYEVHFTPDLIVLVVIVVQLLIDGLLATLVLFLVVELIICIVAILFGLSVLAKGGLHLPGVVHVSNVSGSPAPPQPRPTSSAGEEVVGVLIRSCTGSLSSGGRRDLISHHRATSGTY